ncbi:MAG: penicillin-binding protein 2 [Thermoleophilia bacterium]|nr:penicillin-binding protein 2 [Thermoleophilia bacterium]
MSRATDRRIRLLLAVLLIAFAVALGRAVWLQAVHAAPLARMAQVQHRETVELPASRGTIYDRTGTPLAVGERATTVYADPRRVRDPHRAAQIAGRILGIKPGKLVRRLSDRSKGFVYVARKADPADAAKLAERGLDGFGFYNEERRVYPQRSVGAQVLGFAGVDNRGLEGIEAALDDVLAGAPGRQTIVKDPIGRAIEVVSAIPAREGRDVYLTIDHNIQANAEAVLRDTVRRWNATAASAVVLDPRTGSIVAMASAPTYDANNFPQVAARDLARTKNRAVTDTWEPGSTFKVVTVAGVLAEGLMTPQTAFTLPYEIQVADRRIHDAHERSTQRMTVAEILFRSSNVGTVTVARQLGSKGLAAWVDGFGFGQATGVGFPGESPGIVLPEPKWSGSTIGNVPIGQGIAVTGLQMAAAYATVANRGVWVQPHLVDRIAGGQPKPPKRKRVLSPTVAKTLSRLLVGVVDDEGGTGGLAAVPGYHVAGKTGTAQKPVPGGYSRSDYVASFVGFVPATDPRLVILVTVDTPRNAIWGGTVAAPAFQSIAQFALQYLEVPPDAPLSMPTP